MSNKNDFMINIGANVDETQIRTAIETAIRKISPNATIDIKVNNVNQTVSDANKISDSVSNIGKNTALSIKALDELEKVMQKIISTAETLDKSMTNIRIATADTFDNTLDLMKQLSAKGQGLGATTGEMSSGIETWLRQGKSLENAKALTEETIKFSKVSKKSAEDSAKYLTALSKSYHIADENISTITDKLTAIDSNAAINAGALRQ